MKITNDFSFSHSQLKTFRTCPRRWWLSKVCFWKGWDRNAPENAKLAYRLTKMSGLYRLAGHAVHDIAVQAIRNKSMTAQDGMAEFDRIFDRAISESLSGKWKTNPKHVTNLFEHYYEGAGRPNVIAQRAISRGRACVENLFASPILAEARSSEILSLERLDSMSIDGIKVWVKQDVAYRTETGTVCVWDWKTGRRREEDVFQSFIYGLHARDVLGLPLDEVTVGLEYLSEGTRDAFEVTPEDVAEFRAKIVEGAREIQELLDDPGLNEAPKERFPRTEDVSVCRWCDLFHACKGHRNLRDLDRIVER